MRLRLTTARLKVLLAIAEGTEPQMPGYAARRARQDLLEAGLISPPQGSGSGRSWGNWGLTLDGRMVYAQLGND